MWERLGQPEFATTQPWPSFDPALTVSDTVSVAVQVNGKLRGTFDAARGTSDDELKATAMAISRARIKDGRTS